MGSPTQKKKKKRLHSETQVEVTKLLNTSTQNLGHLKTGFHATSMAGLYPLGVLLTAPKDCHSSRADRG